MKKTFKLCNSPSSSLGFLPVVQIILILILSDDIKLCKIIDIKNLYSNQIVLKIESNLQCAADSSRTDTCEFTILVNFFFFAKYSAVCNRCICPLSAVEQWSVGDPVEVGDSVGDQAQLPLTHLLLTATFPPLPLTFQLGTMILNFSECIQVSLILTVAFICCVRELLMHLM